MEDRRTKQTEARMMREEQTARMKAENAIEEMKKSRPAEAR